MLSAQQQTLCFRQMGGSSTPHRVLGVTACGFFHARPVNLGGACSFEIRMKSSITVTA